jgi:hypothetical protein
MGYVTIFVRSVSNSDVFPQRYYVRILIVCSALAYIYLE